MSIPTIPQYFAGKRIFITGATGFMGKVLVEKLLRSCNDLETVYVLVRGKRGKSAAERWAASTSLPCFDRLKKEFPTALDTKVRVLEGDVKEGKLGLSTEDYELLVSSVDIIYHVAASVRFNEPLNEAIRMNTFGTLQVVELASKIKDLQVLLHVSTTYCYCNKLQDVEEKVYPVNIPWKDAIEISENTDPVVLDTLAKKFTEFAPNTYVFSKALAEHVVNDYRHTVPVVIFRPSIVISSWKEPVPGWIDNFNGPVGLLLAGGKGVLRVCLCQPDTKPDYMAVDVSIKAMIIASYKTGVLWGQKPLGEVEVYNSSSTTDVSISNREVVDFGRILDKEVAMDEVLWAPSYTLTQWVFTYRIYAFFYHFLVAILVDGLLLLIGKSPRLMKIHIKIHVAMMALSYFLTKEFKFRNERFLSLTRSILPEDKDDFDYNYDNLDPFEFFKAAAIGGKMYVLHEDLNKMEEAKKRVLRLVFLDKAIKRSLVILLLYFFLKNYTNFLSFI